VQRLHYLKSSLNDAAVSLQSTNDTFQSLWLSLKERFEVKRVIADSQISEILGLKSLSHESASDLQTLVDVVTKNLRVLETCQQMDCPRS
jgi:aminoglycoside phosphotransferase